MKVQYVAEATNQFHLNPFFRILHLIFVLFDIFLIYYFSFQFFHLYGVPLWIFHVLVSGPSILYQFMPDVRNNKDFRSFIYYLSILSLILSSLHYVMYLNQPDFSHQIMYWLMFMTSALPTAAVSLTLLLSMHFEKELRHHQILMKGPRYMGLSKPMV
mmetsp:Transcript_7018/g.6203  ORF Transcript_7018/g.6203 Transcript_7018/m.6203 type:complete len:158 (-) Transcript_7018:143-616(-)